MSRNCREMLCNVGTLEELLDTIAANELGELIKDARESPPRLKAERVKRLSELLRSGHVDFMASILKGFTKDGLIGMCEAVNLDSTGKLADLENRLLAWWTAQGISVSKSIDRNSTESSKSTLSAAQPVTMTTPIAAVPSASTSQGANPPPPLLSVPISERQFIQVSSKREDSLVSGLMGIASGISRFLEGNATRVLRVHPSTIEQSMFLHGHPVNEGFYVADPFHPTRYIQATDAPRKILEEKIAALTLIAGCLGATRIEFVAITQQGRKITTSSDVEAMGKQVGLDTVLGFQRSSHDRLSTSWPTSEVKPIPDYYLPYLNAMSDLQSLAAMVATNRMPSRMQREIQLDMRDSQDIAVKVSRIPGIGGGAGQLHRTFEESTSWTFAIYFGTGDSTQAPAPPTTQTEIASGKFCTGCGARLALTSRFCGTCGAGVG